MKKYLSILGLAVLIIGLFIFGLLFGDKTLIPDDGDYPMELGDTELSPVATTTIETKLLNKTGLQKSIIKADEIVKIDKVDKVKRDDYSIEITSIKKYISPKGSGGVEVFVRAWDSKGNQIGFGKDGTVDIERFIIINPPVLVQDNNGDITRTYTHEITGVVTTQNFREDLEEALLRSLEHTISVKKQKFNDKKIIEDKVGNTTLTAYPNASSGTAPIDANVGRDAGKDSTDTWSQIRDGAGTTCSNTSSGVATLVQAWESDTTFRNITRGSVGFDTSAIDTDDVDSVIFSGYGKDNANPLGDYDIEIVASTPTSESACASGDFILSAGKWGTTRFATGLTLSSMSVGSYNDFTLNASGEAHINKSGNTIFGLRSSWDLDDSYGGSWVNKGLNEGGFRSADTAGTNQDPKLVVEHSAGGAAVNLDPAVIRFFH